MPMQTLIQPFDQRFVLDLTKDFTDPRTQSEAHAAFHRQARDEAEARNAAVLGQRPRFETAVDGRKGAALESVKAVGGVIVTEFDLSLDVLRWIGEMLVQNSPVLTGRYQDSHTLYADGLQVEPGDVPQGAKSFVFLNVTPYSRKIERGLSPQAPDGVYEGVAMMAARRFGNIAKIKFTYAAPLGGAIDVWARKTTSGRYRSARTRDEWLRRQPAIQIDLY